MIEKTPQRMSQKARRLERRKAQPVPVFAKPVNPVPPPKPRGNTQ